MASKGDRERLRRTFDRASHLYQRARPEYPGDLIDHLVMACDLRSGDRLLEIGCATGKATLPLAGRGFRITCVELGPELAAAARQGLVDFPDVQIVVGGFEDWPMPPDAAFDLVYAATAWHWIDPAVRYAKAAAALRPGGHLGFWDAVHVFPDDGDPFFAELQDVYDELGEGLPPGSSWPRPGELADSASEIEASRLFDEIQIRHFDWEQAYDAESYIELLS